MTCVPEESGLFLRGTGDFTFPVLIIDTHFEAHPVPRTANTADTFTRE